jgi:hypothetical protein
MTRERGLVTGGASGRAYSVLVTPFRILLACLAVLLVVGVAAQLDHRHKQAVENEAIRDQWFCVHRGTRCGGADPDAVARRWHTREKGYKVVFGGAALAGALGLVAAVRRRAT